MWNDKKLFSFGVDICCQICPSFLWNLWYTKSILFKKLFNFHDRKIILSSYKTRNIPAKQIQSKLFPLNVISSFSKPLKFLIFSLFIRIFRWFKSVLYPYAKLEYYVDLDISVRYKKMMIVRNIEIKPFAIQVFC